MVNMKHLAAFTVAAMIIIWGTSTYISHHTENVKASEEVHLIDEPQKVVESSSEEDYEVFLNSIRTPRGFSDTKAVNTFALENGIIEDLYFLNDPITIGELSHLLKNIKEYYSLMPDGFGDKMKESDVDTSVIPNTNTYAADVKFSLIHGYITTEQAGAPNETITLNELTRILFNVGVNGLPYTEPTEEMINAALEAVKEVTKEDKPCRIAKVTFLNQYDLIPFTYKGDFPLERIVTKQDAINIFITFIDTLDIYGINSENPNVGCAPCADTALVLERERYNEK